MPVHYEKRQFAKEKHNVKVTFLFVFIKLLNERILPQEDLKMAEESHVRLPSWVTITFVDNKAELYSESALRKKQTNKCMANGTREKKNIIKQDKHSSSIKRAHKTKI